MGRAKKLKQLRKLASTLPPDFYARKVGEKIEGHELIKVEDMTELPDGTPVDPDKTYRRVNTELGHVNHYRKMKAMLRKGNALGMMAYIDTVDAKHQARLAAIAEEEAKKQEAAQQETEK